MIFFSLRAINIQFVNASDVSESFASPLSYLNEEVNIARSIIDKQVEYDDNNCENKHSTSDVQEQRKCERINLFLDLFYQIGNRKSNFYQNDYESENPLNTTFPVKSDSTLSYGDFFSSHEIKGVPLIIKDIPKMIKDDKKMFALSHCINRTVRNHTFEKINDEKNKFPLFNLVNDKNFGSGSRIPKRNNHGAPFIKILKKDFCQDIDLKEELSFPKYVLNDYLLRNKKHASNLNMYDEFFLQATNFDTFNTIKSGDASCPASLNGLYILQMIDSEHQPRAVKARIFQPQNEPELHPYIMIDLENFPYISTDVLVDPWEVTQESYNEINVDVGSAIFVPSGTMISFKKEISTDLQKNDVTLFRFCFLDASNLNAFKSHL